ncbi:MAG: Fe-Mn family superoxide dismutase [Candidatus Moraniibacteriota bacterium]
MPDIYKIKDFKHLLGLPGLSDALLTNHFTLYEGYVKNTNTLLEFLDSKEPGTPEYSELQRRFGWEWNGMRLHELYFGNMTKSPASISEGALKEAIEKTFGSIENWQKNFLAIGAMRGIGWVILTQDTETSTVLNVWVNEHDGGHLAGTTPLLVMDVFEHAFMLDYGIKRADYLSAFMNAIDWNTVESRLTA